MKAIDVNYKVNGQKIKTVEEVLESSDFKTVNGENIVGSGDIEIDADVEAIYATETEKDGAYVPDLTDAQISQIYTAYVNKKHIRIMTFSDTRRFYDVLNASDMSCCLLAQMGYIVDYFDFAGEVYIEVHQAGGGGGSVEIDNESITKNTNDELQAVGVIDEANSVNKIHSPLTMEEYEQLPDKDLDTWYPITDDFEYEHLVNVTNTTPQNATWDYQFRFKSSTKTPYVYLTNVGEFLYNNYRDIKIPATGTYTINSTNEVYFVMSVKGVISGQNYMVEIEYRKASDGSKNTIESGLLPIVDKVH